MLTITIAGASAGSGHMCAAHSLALAFETAAPDARLYCLDSLEILSSVESAILREGWQFGSLSLPAVYSRLHRALITNAPFLGWRRVAGRTAAERLTRLLGSPPDVFIATHPAAVAIGSAFAQLGKTRLFVVATDFILHALHYDPSVERYYVPPGFRGIGIEASHDSVVESGIPLSPSFSVSRKSRGSSEGNARVAVVSFGGRALLASRGIALLDLVCSLFDEVVVLCGNHPKTAIKFATAVRKLANVTSVRFAPSQPEVATILANGDVFLGKPGGVSISEALCFGLPI